MNGRFQVERMLGQGGYARTWLAKEAATGRNVCLKELDPKLGTAPNHIQRFCQEGEVGRSISHPHVVRYLESWQGASFSSPGRTTWFLSMEYLPSGDLRNFVLKHGHPGLDESLRMASEFLSGLTELHRLGLVHRDIKPENLLLSETGSVKIGDLGILRARRSTMTAAGSALGTLLYMPPEQARGELSRIGAWTDVYAAGATIYWLLTGHEALEDAQGELPPRDMREEQLLRQIEERTPRAPREWRSEIPKAVEAMLGRAMEKNPTLRFPNAQTMLESLVASSRTKGVRKPHALECREGPYRGERLLLTRPLLRLGRVRGDRTFPADPHMSAEHAQIDSVEDGWRLCNGRPTVPTRLNRLILAPGQKVLLDLGDRIQMGSSVFLAV